MTCPKCGGSTFVDQLKVLRHVINNSVMCPEPEEAEALEAEWFRSGQHLDTDVKPTVLDPEVVEQLRAVKIAAGEELGIDMSGHRYHDPDSINNEGL